MESASKALLMTGAVLIGLLILSLAVYLFATFGADARKNYAQMEQTKLSKYNVQYTVYDGREDITIYEIISIANLAKQNNEYYKDYQDFTDEYKVTVYLNGVIIQDKSAEEKQKLLEENSNIDTLTGKLSNMFTCSKIEYHEVSGKVREIRFRDS